jgi:hypothetical protein
METKKTSQKSKAREKALAIMSLGASSILLLTCIVLHVNPLQLEGLIFDYAVHHYFMFGFISLLLVLFSIKLYLSIYNEALKNPADISQIIRASFHKRRYKPKYYYNEINSTIEKSNIAFVDTKTIDHLNFSQEDVLINHEQKKLRELELKKSMTLGNQYKQKVKIFFQDENRKLFTETTVWHADQKYISLKGGVALPVRSIYKVVI